MKLKSKKITFSLIAFLNFFVLANVISCGVVEPSIIEKEKYQAFNSEAMESKIEDQWLEKMMQKIHPNENTGFKKHDPIFNTDVLNGFNFFLSQKIKEKEDKLIEIKNNNSNILFADKILELISSPISIKDGLKNFNKNQGLTNIEEKNKKLKTWNFEYLENGDIKDLSLEGKKFIIYNFPELRKEFYKFYISTYFIKNTNKTTYEKFLKDQNIDHEFSELEKIIHENNFILINSALKKRLFAKWKIEFKKEDSKPFINKTEISTLNDLKNLFISGDIFDKINSNYFTQSKAKTNELDLINLNTMIAYNGIKPADIKNGKDQLAFTKNEFKKITDANDWKGSIYDNEFKKTDIPYQLESDSLILNLNYSIGIFPIFKNDKLSFEDTDLDIDKLAYLFAYKFNDFYDEAIDFFTSDIHENNDYLLEIPNKKLREKMIEKFSFIKEEE